MNTVLSRLGMLLHRMVLIATVVFLLGPIVVIIILSFSADEYMTLPPQSWGMRQYQVLFSNTIWLEPFIRSLIVAFVVGVLAVVIGLPASIALARTKVPGRNFVQFAGIGPLLAPITAYAIALFSLFSWLGILGTPVALLLSHTTLVVPFVLLIVGGAILRIPRSLELAALNLGASRIGAWWDVTLPMLIPAVLGSFLFAFIFSFDEPVIASFVAGASYQTLPVAIFSSVRTGVDPVISAIATLLMALTALVLGVWQLLRRWHRRGAITSDR